MLKDAPVQGHGFGHYFQHVKPYYAIRSYGLPLEIARNYNQHNVLLSVAVDTGLIGLVMFTALLVNWVRGGLEIVHLASDERRASTHGTSRSRIDHWLLDWWNVSGRYDHADDQYVPVLRGCIGRIALPSGGRSRSKKTNRIRDQLDCDIARRSRNCNCWWTVSTRGILVPAFLAAVMGAAKIALSSIGRPAR